MTALPLRTLVRGSALLAVSVLLSGGSPAVAGVIHKTATRHADHSARIVASKMSLPETTRASGVVGVVAPPPMGWNPYNHFGRSATASLVEAEAKAMVTSGMKGAGYSYVNLDGGWDLLARSARGALQADPKKFPQGIKPVAAYVHGLGLKFGIYASAGTRNCAGSSAGSYGHYAEDAAAFAAWGVDYVKLDWCYVPYGDFRGMSHTLVSEILASQMAQAMAQTGRPMLYDINDTNWNNEHPWNWAPKLARMWRITWDIHDNYSSMVTSFLRDVSRNADAGRNGWNDPDMLEVGNRGLTPVEWRTQFSLWAELAAPLIAGNDISKMSVDARSVLTNRSVIAVDQDPLGVQGYSAVHDGNRWILTKPMAKGNRAVVLFNQGSATTVITTTAAQVGMPKAALYRLDDLWTGTRTDTTGAITQSVPPHAVVMYLVSAESVQQS